MDQEIWKPIAVNYMTEVSSWGRVRSRMRYPQGRILSLNVNKLGYVKVGVTDLTQDKYSIKRMKLYSVHHLVAEAFLEKPEGKKEVNHKDGNKQNNHVGNLEWVTHKENIQHTFESLGRKQPAGKDHWLYGTKAKPKTKAIMSQKKIGVNHPKYKRSYLSPEGLIFHSLNAAAKHARTTPKKLFEIEGWKFINPQDVHLYE
jgi:hypothetical protein